MIAISYRREDSLPVAGRLYDRLQAEFGKGNVFMDFDSIPYGVDFREHIKQVIGRSKLLVAMIGPDWVGKRRHRTRRIDDPADFVRLEIGYALERGLPVIPVLIDDTPMPSVSELPVGIEALAFRNALVLDAGIDFHHHADRLISGINRLLIALAPPPLIVEQDRAPETLQPVQAPPPIAMETPVRLEQAPPAPTVAKTPPALPLSGAPPKLFKPTETEKPGSETARAIPSEPSKPVPQAMPPAAADPKTDRSARLGSSISSPPDKPMMDQVRRLDGARGPRVAKFWRDRKRIVLFSAVSLFTLALAAAAWHRGSRAPGVVVAMTNPSATPAQSSSLSAPAIASLPRPTPMPAAEATASPRTRVRGALKMETSPQGVAFDLDDGDRNHHIGITPAVVGDLPAGPTQITFKSGDREHRETLWIEEGKTSSIAWSVPQPAPSVAKTTITPAPSSVPTRQAQMVEFVRRFVESNASGDVHWAVSFYASNAEIFEEGRKNLDAIRHDIQTYNERWPMRRDSIRGDIQLDERVPDQEYSASFHQDYYVENQAHREWIKGEAAVDLQITVIDGLPKIASIKQKVLSREKGTGPGPKSREAPNPAVQQSAPQGLVRVVNKTYGFSVLVPADVFPDATRPSDADRTTFTSPSGRITLNLLVRQNTDGEMFNKLYQEWMAEHTKTRPNKTVHYRVLRDNWFVVSGTEGERGFYVKGVKKGKLVVMISLDYVENASPLKTDTLLMMSRSFDGN